MAISLGQMEAKLTLDASQYMSGMSAAQGALAGFEQNGESASAFIAGLEAALGSAAAHISEYCREIWQAWQEQPVEVKQPVEITAEPTVNSESMPSPEELEAMYGPLEPAQVEQPVEVTPEPEPVAEVPYWDFGYTPEPIEESVPVNATLTAGEIDVGGLTAALAAAGGEAKDAYVAPIEDGGSSASAAAQGMASEAGSGAATATAAFSSAGSNAGSAFAAGIRSQISSAVSAAATMAAQAAAAARAKLSIHSPSKVFREMGANTTRGFALGISDEITSARQAINRLATESIRAAAPITNNDRRSLTINISGASIAPGTDVRKFSRQLAQYIQGANFGVT